MRLELPGILIIGAGTETVAGLSLCGAHRFIGPATLGVHRVWARERRLTSELPSAVEAAGDVGLAACVLLCVWRCENRDVASKETR
jgi:hypothetical protein